MAAGVLGVVLFGRVLLESLLDEALLREDAEFLQLLEGVRVVVCLLDEVRLHLVVQVVAHVGDVAQSALVPLDDFLHGLLAAVVAQHVLLHLVHPHDVLLLQSRQHRVALPQQGLPRQSALLPHRLNPLFYSLYFVLQRLPLRTGPLHFPDDQPVAPARLQLLFRLLRQARRTYFLIGRLFLLALPVLEGGHFHLLGSRLAVLRSQHVLLEDSAVLSGQEFALVVPGLHVEDVGGSPEFVAAPGGLVGVGGGRGGRGGRGVGEDGGEVLAVAEGVLGVGDHNKMDQAFFLRRRALRMTSEKCLVMVLQLSTSLIIWMQYLRSPSENLGLNTTKKQQPYLSSQTVPSANEGIFPPVRLMRPSTCPVPSLSRNMFKLFSRRKFSRRPTMETVQKLWPSKVESSWSSWLSWQRVSGMMALSLTGLQSFLEFIAPLLSPPTPPPLLLPICPFLTAPSQISRPAICKSGRSAQMLAAAGDAVGWVVGESLVLQQFDILMHPNMSREAPTHPTHRERPLQKSMFLPETHPQTHTRQSPPLEAFLYGGLKRAVPSDSVQLSPPFLYNHTYPPPPAYQQNLNVGQYLPERPQSQHELLHLGNSASLKNLGSAGRSEQSGEGEGRGFARMEKQGGYEGRTSLHVLTDAPDGQTAEMLALLREKHLPTLLTSLKKEIYEDINSIRVEFQSLREEIKNQNGRQETVNAELRSLATRDKKSDFAELQTHFFLLEGKLTQVEAKVADNCQRLAAEVEKLASRLDSDLKGSGVRAGAIRSSLSPVLLEYREILAVRRPNETMRKEDEVVISSCEYHIDRQGYLLDHDNRYLIDSRGAQIRLQERHLRLLENSKILHR